MARSPVPSGWPQPLKSCKQGFMVCGVGNGAFCLLQGGPGIHIPLHGCQVSAQEPEWSSHEVFPAQ